MTSNTPLTHNAPFLTTSPHCRQYKNRGKNFDLFKSYSQLRQGDAVSMRQNADAAEHFVLHGKMHLQIFDFEQCTHLISRFKMKLRRSAIFIAANLKMINYFALPNRSS